MSQNPSGEPPGGGQTDAQPSVPVTPSGEEQTSQGEQITLESLNAKLEELSAQVGKRQSAKDKAINRVEDEITSLRADFARYEELKGRGMTPEDAQFRMQMEEFLKAQGQRAGQPPGQATPQQAPSVDVQAVLSATGLRNDDPQVTAILGQQGDPTAALVQLANQRKMAPNPAGVMPGGGGPTPQANLREQYEKEVAPLRGKPGADYAIAQLQAKYHNLGLDV